MKPSPLVFCEHGAGNRYSMPHTRYSGLGTDSMSPIPTAILLGLTAAGANVFGGAIIVQRNWERRYLRYFVALGAGFMLATAIVEVVPESIELRGKSAGPLV